MKKIIFVFLFLACKITSFAQTDTAFWFAAPDIEIVNHPIYGEYDRPIYLRLTSFTSAANVTISIPANPGFTPVSVNIPAGSTSTVDLTPWINLIENSDPTNIANKGIYIQSTTDITAYYEVNSITCNCNPELFSLKARNAIGNEFYVPSQLTWAVDTVRHPNAKAGFDIVATQNNTIVTITPTKALIGHPTNVPFSITLNKGQSYACIALYRNGSSMLNGSKVVSDKPIAVTTYEDLLFSDGACADLAGDQLIPTSIYGFEFAVVRGNLTTRDKVIVTAVQNNTNIYLNGSAVAAATINAGQSFEYDMLPATPSLYITTSKASGVFHYTGSGCEVGAAVIPKLTCTGSSSVSLVRTSNGGNASVMIVTKNGNQGSFLVNGVAGIITAADFSPLTGTAGNYVYAKKDVTASMPLNAATTFSNTAGKFQLGFFNVTASNGGCMYGFFSDFKKSNVTNAQVETCRFDSVQLNANGGITYQWTPTTGLSNPNISNPKASPAVTTDYKVVITDVDGCIDSAFVKVIVNTCTLSCNNWLSTPTDPSPVVAGDIDVTGNQLTVEATFNRTVAPPVPGSYGFLLSKNTNAFDNNYAIWPNGCALTTVTHPEAFALANCDIELNKTYHVAMVYDGSNLKFYRNGFLHSQTPITGNLVNNNLLTYIANNPPGSTQFQFLGYMNEVRIWNVARTQAQIQTYMNNSLPNPTTTPGLLAYYTFDNLLNKQGNAAFNATLNGAATINNTNPNCTFVADSCNVTPPPPTCNSSFELAKPNNSYVRILPAAPATYNQLYNSNGFSWETWFKLNGPITNLSTLISTEDAVLFHDIFLGFGWGSIPNALCFLVSDNGSNNATVVAESAQSLTVGTWYHVAAVCDYSNAILKLYLNGNIIATKPIPAGILNDRLTTNVSTQIGNASSSLIYGIDANMDETRFWNTVRSQAEIQASMNQCLSNPQPGLVAYFKADELVGTTAASAVNNNFSGSLSNTTWGTQTPSVNCGCVTSTSVIINDYTPVLGLNPCTNALTVEDGTAYNAGDTVLLIQMKGAVIDSTNTAAFGTITDYKNAGNYEFNYVKSKSGNIIELTNTLTRQYDIPAGKVQLIRVPYYTNLTTTDTLTCLPWDGSKGGVLAFNVQNTLTLNTDIDVSGKGFKGGVGYNPGNASLTCNENNFNYPLNTIFAAQKGESITTISNNIICGKGSPAGGGGGGLGHNSGGGGGGNGGIGGFGGYQLEPCGSAPFNNRGIGGRQLAYSTASNKIYLGSGGGAGHADNPGNIPPGGGNGAGIIIISADKLQSNAKKITANGGNSVVCSIPSSTDCHDATGGGGAGGTILLNVNQFLDNASIENKGGKAADVIGGPISVAGRIGPGGGGAGGLAFLKAASQPANLTITNTGGLNGVLTQDANNPWGATPGAAGQNLFNLVLPIDNVPFQKNIDSVRIKDSLLNCNGFDFKGLAYINTAPITSWQWYFGDGGQATTQNTSHAYTTAGLFTVKLIVTDINGCIDSTTKDVNALPGVNAEAGSDTSICTNGSASVTLNGTAVGGPYLWSPAIYLNNPNIQNPIATISTTTTFYLNVTGSASCTSIDSVTIYINPLPLVNARADTTICRLSSLVLNTTSNAVSYQWNPPAYVSNPNIASPNYVDNFSHRVYVTGTSALGCMATDSLDVTVNPLPVVQTIADTTLCQTENVTLTTTGAQTYSWSPAIGLSNPVIANPVFIGTAGQTYTVTGTDANGCKNNDLVTITVIMPGTFKAPPAFTICQKQSVQLDGNNGNQVSYLWSPATYLSNATIINPLANPPQTTLYTLLVTDNRCGYDSTFTTLLTVVPAPVINTGKSNDIDCALKSATLFASGGNQYLWSPSAGLSNPNISNPVATPVNTQTYNVLVKDATGCTNTDSVTIFIKKAASLARYMPNAFTPDGNGINDCYGLKNWMYIQKLQFYIFNRYGEQVFATSNPNVCWDGTYKGKPALAGTYVYVIKAQTDCGEEEQKGSFILIR